MDLNALRDEIDKIDDELLALLLRRMAITQDVARYKIEHQLPVLNQRREDEILRNVAQKSGPLAAPMKSIFAAIMDVSRAGQHQLMGGGDVLKRTILEAGHDDITQKACTVACPGVKGSYSSEAARKLFGRAELRYCTDFSDVFEAVKNQEADYGIVPVENSTAGSVHETYDLIMKYRFYMVGAVDLSIHNCLCAPKGVSLDDVKRVYSHPQGLMQCADFIKEHSMSTVKYSNTAAAAKFVSESGEKDAAAICSRFAGEEYGLEILKEDIQISDTNATRFIIISRTLIISDDADKISLIFSIPHVTGSLYRILGRFSTAGLNLTKLESRPLRQENFSYHFYLDLGGSIHSEQTLSLICALSRELPSFTFLGNYREVI